MKHLLLFLFLFKMTTGFTQDSSAFQKIKFEYLKVSAKRLCNSAVPIQNEAEWKQKMIDCDIKTAPPIDFTKYNVWMKHSLGDCHATFTHDLWMDNNSKKVIWVEHEKYGGCRAAKFTQFWILFPKQADAQRYEISELQDR